MKRFLSLLLCLILVGSMLTLVACDDTTTPPTEETTESNDDSNKPSTPKKPKEGVDVLNGKTPEELYQAALEKVKSITNYEMTTNQVITMTYGDQEMPINQVVISKLDGQNQYVKTTNDFESSLNMEMWYVNEWMYVIAQGNRNKANITHERMQEEFAPEGSNSSGALMNIPEKWLKNVKFEKDGDLYYIEFTVSGEEYLQYMQSTSIGDQISNAEDIIYKVYFDENGELGDIITEFDYVVEEGGLTINCNLVSTSTISNIGTVTITEPEGSFIDVTNYI